MPTIVKVPAAVAATWTNCSLSPAEVERLLQRWAGEDRRGLTRIDRPGPTGGEHCWRARIWTRERELHRGFADSLYGGPAAALRLAIAWRDAQRAQLPPKPERPERPWRIVRVAYERATGYLAYADRRKFFSVLKYGEGGAREAAEAWLLSRYEG